MLNKTIEEKISICSSNLEKINVLLQYIEKLERENFGLKKTVTNLKEKDDNRYRWKYWNESVK